MVLQLKGHLESSGHMDIADQLLNSFSETYKIDLTTLSIKEMKDVLKYNDWIRLAFAIKYGEQLHWKCQTQENVGFAKRLSL